jgi:hypothetical protein
MASSFGMIEEMASSYWRLRRLWAIENSLLTKVLPFEPAGDDVGRIAATFRKLAASPDLASCCAPPVYQTNLVPLMGQVGQTIAFCRLSASLMLSC